MDPLHGLVKDEVSCGVEPHFPRVQLIKMSSIYLIQRRDVWGQEVRKHCSTSTVKMMAYCAAMHMPMVVLYVTAKVEVNAGGNKLAESLVGRCAAASLALLVLVACNQFFFFCGGCWCIGP